jgi:hypothetical protein
MGTAGVDRWDHERPIEKVIVLLARRLGNQHAAVTGSSVQKTVFMGIRRSML